MEYTKEELYILGQAYRIISDLVKPGGASTSDMTIAEITPYEGYTLMFMLAVKQRKITTKIDKVLAKLMNQLDEERLSTLFEQPTPMELRMSWHRGYMDALNLLKDSKLKTKRLSLKISQEELANKIGCTQKDISRWESGNVTPTIDNLKLLADALECKIEEII